MLKAYVEILKIFFLKESEVIHFLMSSEGYSIRKDTREQMIFPPLAFANVGITREPEVDERKCLARVKFCIIATSPPHNFSSFSLNTFAVCR